MSGVHTIDSYLNRLESLLNELPADERRHHINEIRDHLLELTEENSQHEKQTVELFMSPEKLSNEILQEEQDSKRKEFELPDYWFGVTVVSVIAPFGALALPMTSLDLNVGLQLPFILQFIVGISVLFGYYKDKLTSRRVDILRTIGRIMILVLAIPFGLFSISIIQSDGMIIFNVYYLMCYLIVWTLSYFSIRNLYKKNSSEVVA